MKSFPFLQPTSNTQISAAEGSSSSDPNNNNNSNHNIIITMPSTSSALLKVWNTKFTSKFPSHLPIMGAPMAGVSGGLLAYETCRAGALGFIAAGHNTSLESINEQVAVFLENNTCSLPPAPLCIGFIGHSTFANVDGWQRFETVLQTHQPDVVQFFAPSIVNHPGDSNKTNVDLAKSNSNNCLVIAQVGNVTEGIQALDAGVDGLIAQGSEAGGHGLRPSVGCGTFSLASSLLSIRDKSYDSNIPILAAGGIVNGHDMAAALALGCDGVVVGTRLWASNEALGHDKFKQKLVDATTDDAIRTPVFDQIQNSFSSTPWPYPYDTVGVVKNETTEEWDGKPESELAAALKSSDNIATQYKEAVSDGDPQYAPVYAGKGVGNIHSIEPSYDIITNINEGAMHIIDTIHTKILEPK